MTKLMIYHTLREIREGFLEKLSSKGCMAEGWAIWRKTSYIIPRAQCKIKMPVPFFKKH